MDVHIGAASGEVIYRDDDLLVTKILGEAILRANERQSFDEVTIHDLVGRSFGIQRS